MYFSVVLLGILQGIAEFLPISSSAHLIIFREVFGIGKELLGSGDLGMTFDIALHFGTLMAIALYFFKDFWNMVIKGITRGTRDKEGRIFYYIIAATIPAAIAGVLFEDVVEGFFRNQPIIIACALIFMGIVIYLVDKNSKSNKHISDMTIKDALLIGCSQIFALIPGFSRSGTTISAARYLKLDREDAAKFSFYLSAPIIFGAVLLFVLKGNFDLVLANLSIFVTGVMVAFISGLLCIKYLLKYLKKHDFEVFMWYRIALGILVILCTIF